MNEIKLLSSVSRPNLVCLLGYCIEKGEQILVYEFMQNGTLSQHLRRQRTSGVLNPKTLATRTGRESKQKEDANIVENIKDNHNVGSRLASGNNANNICQFKFLSRG
ncbi:hypothetical protein JHK84_030434 [Glycine max]|nr:hypothetical protein JHK84_030434 [Glycine max]